jgi:hypothetical protein
MARRLVVIGGGPVGIAAAVDAVARGFDVLLFERDQIASTVRQWGQTRFFTPLSMNVTDRMLSLLGERAPDPSSILTAPEFIDEVLMPIARHKLLQGVIHEQHEVVAAGRRGLTKMDHAGHPLRAERPFRLLVRTPDGERSVEAEIVLDASGGYRRPTWLGQGGIPAAGEIDAAPWLIRSLGQLESLAGPMEGGNILLAGHGHSAVNALLVLERIAGAAPGTRVTWAVRTANRRPCAEVPSDPLPERAQLVARANDLAERPPEFLRVERRATVEEIRRTNGHFEIALSGDRGGSFDNVVACTGYRPDAEFTSELNLEISPVTEGGTRLARALSNVTDCLAAPRLQPSDLTSGEPGYFLIGSRAYGRMPTFLLQSGYDQLSTIFDSLGSG